jgi:hypothetical protein
MSTDTRPSEGAQEPDYTDNEMPLDDYGREVLKDVISAAALFKRVAEAVQREQVQTIQQLTENLKELRDGIALAKLSAEHDEAEVQRLTEERDELRAAHKAALQGQFEAAEALTAERAQRERLEQELRDIYQHNPK